MYTTTLKFFVNFSEPPCIPRPLQVSICFHRLEMEVDGLGRGDAAGSPNALRPGINHVAIRNKGLQARKTVRSPRTYSAFLLWKTKRQFAGL